MSVQRNVIRSVALSISICSKENSKKINANRTMVRRMRMRENTNLFSYGWMTSPFVSWTIGISISKSEHGDFQSALLTPKPKIGD